MENSGTFTAPKGDTVYYQYWDTAAPKAVLIMFHGLGEHIARYDHVARFFNEKHIAFAGFDWLGHGKTSGHRGHAENLDHLLDTAQAFIDQVKVKYPDTPWFVYGHSMGGNLALNYLLRRTHDARGGIITDPWIQLAFKPNAMMVAAAKVVGKYFPKFTQGNGLKTEHLSRDQAVVDAYEADPLVHSKITAGLGLSLLKSSDWLDAYEDQISLSLLLMHGTADQITSAPATQAFAERQKGDVSYKAWDGLYHEIHNEPEKGEVLDFVHQWIESKIS